MDGEDKPSLMAPTMKDYGSTMYLMGKVPSSKQMVGDMMDSSKRIKAQAMGNINLEMENLNIKDTLKMICKMALEPKLELASIDIKATSKIELNMEKAK